MAITQNYVDPVGGSDLAAGTLVAPWKTLQWAFDHVVRNIADGNQVNLKATGAHVNAATLDLTVFIAAGALSRTAPLIMRGYTVAANDGGVGVIDCNGVTMWASTSYAFFVLTDLTISNGGDTNMVAGGASNTVFRCTLHRGASAPASKSLLSLTGAGCVVYGCYLYNQGSGNSRNITIGGSSKVIGNYIVLEATANSPVAIVIGGPSTVLSNVIALNGITTTGISVGGTLQSPAVVMGNIIYSFDASTGNGIIATNPEHFIMNNIICGISGVGGDAINVANVEMLGYNAFWNNTNTNTVSDQKFIDLTAKDVALGADPFTNAAAGDFSLTAAAKAALRDVGWPEAYLGAHVNTDGHITIGPVQYGEAVAAGGGALGISPYRGMIG